MRSRFTRAALAAAALVALSPAHALDLADAYRLAYTQDATIRDSRAAAEAGRERLPQARAQFMPSVNAMIARSRNQLLSNGPGSNGQNASSFDRYSSSGDTLSVRQPLYRKQLTAQYRSAEASVADVNAQLERDEQSLVMRVTQAYFESLLAEEQVRLVKVQEEAYATQLDAARKGFAAGAGTRTDIDEAQAKYDLSVAQELEARQNVDLTRRKLEVMVNQPLGTLAPLDVGRLQLVPPEPATLEAWTAMAEDASPEIASARAQVAQARAEVDRVRAGHYPTLDAVVQLSRTSSQDITRINNSYYQKQFGLELNVPLFAGGYVNSQVREALANLERSEAKYEETRRDLGVRVHQEFRGVTEGILKVRALEQAVKSSEQAVLSSRKSFEAGVRTRVDILNAEQQAGQARRDLAQARFTYLVSRIRLRALAGSYKPANIDEINGWLQH